MSGYHWLARAKRAAKEIKQNIYALYLACRDPRVPRHAKLFALCVVAYVFSPIDLIPDFIPILGYVDDLILVPAGIALAVRMIPADVMADSRAKAEEARKLGKPRNWIAAAVFIAIWLLFAVWMGSFLYRMIERVR